MIEPLYLKTEIAYGRPPANPFEPPRTFVLGIEREMPRPIEIGIRPPVVGMYPELRFTIRGGEVSAEELQAVLDLAVHPYTNWRIELPR